MVISKIRVILLLYYYKILTNIKMHDKEVKKKFNEVKHHIETNSN